MHAARNSITTNHGHCRLPAAAKTGASQKERPLKTVDSPATIVPQFELQNHGSLFLLRPLTPAAKEWMRDHLPEDSPETQFSRGASNQSSREFWPMGWCFGDPHTHAVGRPRPSANPAQRLSAYRHPRRVQSAGEKTVSAATRLSIGLGRVHAVYASCRVRKPVAQSRSGWLRLHARCSERVVQMQLKQAPRSERHRHRGGNPCKAILIRTSKRE